MFRYEFLKFQDRVFIIKKKIWEHHLPIIDTWKEHLSADTVLRKDGILYFLELVQDVEIEN